MNAEMPDDVKKFALLVSEVNTRFPQLANQILTDAKVMAVLTLVEKYGIGDKEFNEQWIKEIEKYIEALRILPNQQ